MRTLTGLSLDEAIQRIREPMDKDAYKPIPGSRGLTEIDPHYSCERFTEVFGLCGIGWKFEYGEVELERTTQGKHDAFEANVHLKLQYRIDMDGTLEWSEVIPSNGGSVNVSKPYAIRGAITNALGSAFSRLTFQLPIYQGIAFPDVGKKGKRSGNGTPSAMFWQTVEELGLDKGTGQRILSECGGDYAQALLQLETTTA